jgi:hypothetical protein
MKFKKSDTPTSIPLRKEKEIFPATIHSLYYICIYSIMNVKHPARPTTTHEAVLDIVDEAILPV